MSSAHLTVQIITALSSMLALGWLWQAVAALRGVPTLPDLTRAGAAWADPAESAAPDVTVPDVTVIVPACNEQESIQATLRCLLASTGVRLQIVAVNDRSTDGTGELMDAVAAEAQAVGGPHSLEVIHNRELPPGWLGKAHALTLADERATAPWLLFTDGDVTFAPRLIALALGYARAERADHVVLILTMQLKNVAEAAVLAAFQALASWNTRLWKVADPKARDFFGTGGFNLVRREIYERLGGFAAMRMEVVEDLRLGWKIKRAGYAQRIVLGPGLARIRWINGALSFVGLVEKNGYAGLRYRAGISLLAFLGFAVQIVLPLAAMACGGWAALAGLLTYVLIAVAYAANRSVTQVSPWVAVFFAPATAILLFAFARSMFLTIKRNGVVWRGTHYPLDELRRNAGRGWGDSSLGG
ncbi:MAG TPA: glycosyltransferase family 2 protein [Terracidiphilus sp.]|jgi:glycosyltransferase involved in cell wall biosynthesis|nr:glycosyltransferase family 2 protein [Terracidiphilus sp.]